MVDGNLVLIACSEGAGDASCRAACSARLTPSSVGAGKGVLWKQRCTGVSLAVSCLRSLATEGTQ